MSGYRKLLFKLIFVMWPIFILLPNPRQFSLYVYISICLYQYKKTTWINVLTYYIFFGLEERIPNGHAQQYDRPKSGYY